MPPRAGRSADDDRFEAWAVAAPGLEALLAAELRALGFNDAKATTGGVAFRCDAYGLAKAQVWSRLASRVLVRLATFRATAFHELERGARKVDWAHVIPTGVEVALRVTCRKSKLYHSDAVAQRVEEAIARAVPGAAVAARGDGPSGEDEGHDEGEVVRKEEDASGTTHPAPPARATQLIVVRLDHDRCTISADASGELLHRRGYRLAVARAPLRETLAAAMLAAAPWDPRTPLVDPMCGSGTIPIEAALVARRIAPGLHRTFAAERWPMMDVDEFARAREAAAARVLPPTGIPILGSDRDAGAIAAARENAARAGVEADIEFSQRALSALEPPPGTPGLLITNPPYGVRVGEKEPLRDLFARLGQVARAKLPGWRVAMLSAERNLEAQVALPFEERFRTSNGGIDVRLVAADVPG